MKIIKSGPSQASSSSRLKNTGTRLLLYTGNKERFLCCRDRRSEMSIFSISEVRNAKHRHFGSPKRRLSVPRHFGTSTAWPGASVSILFHYFHHSCEFIGFTICGLLRLACAFAMRVLVLIIQSNSLSATII